jgi:hypothetical protein
MEFAPIAPLSLFSTVATITPYRMALPSMYRTDQRNGGQYQYASRMRTAKAAGAYVILDNGVSEYKYPLKGRKLMEVVRAIQPSELVLPDYLGDPAATVLGAYDGLNYFEHHMDPELLPNFMAVAQGQSLSEYVDCIRSLATTDGISCIGLSKYFTENTHCPRSVLLEEVHKLVEVGLIPSEMKFHLLGISGEESVDIIADYAMSYIWLRGIDTCWPVLMAMKGLSITTPGAPIHTSPEGFEEAAVVEYHVFAKEVYDLLRHNLKAFKYACMGQRPRRIEQLSLFPEEPHPEGGE